MAEPITASPSASPVPSPGDQELLSFLTRIDDEIRQVRQATSFDKNCEAWLAARNGNMRPPGEPEPVFQANLLGAFIDRKVAQLTQSKPDLRVGSRNPSLSPMAHVLTDTAKAALDGAQLDARLEVGADLAATFGYVGFLTAWDPSRDDIVLEVLDPRRFAVDHHVKDPADIQKACYLRIDTPMPLDDVRAIWPDRGRQVTAAADSQSTGRFGRWSVTNWITMGGKKVLRPWAQSSGPYEWVTVSEYWIKSSQLGEDGPLFPTGRVVHRAGNVILDDQPNPYWDGLWPIDIWDWRVNGDSHTGRSDVEEGRKLQESINRIGNAITKNIILNGAITVVGDHNALSNEDWKKLDNRAARILRKQPGRELQFLPPPPIPDTYLNFTMQLTSLMESVVGVPPTMQGKRQPGVVASSAVEGLMTQAETPIRAAARRLEYVIERIGHKLVSRIIQFYDSDRIMMVNGEDGDVESYVFKRAELLGTYLDGLEGPERDEALRALHTNFIFKVIPLSSMPSNKIQRGLMAIQLMQAGLIDDEEAMRYLELPDAKYLLKKVRAKNQAAQQETLQKSTQLQLMGVDPEKSLPGPGGGAKPPKSSRDGTKMKA